SKLHFLFDRGVQQRGLRLYNSRLVQVDEASPDSLSGKVMGGSLYPISLRYQDSVLQVACECPYFADHSQCKHLWAGILEADRLGSLRNAAHSVNLSLEDAFRGRRPALPARDRYVVAPQAAEPQMPEWHESLSLIQRSLDQPKHTPDSWPRGFELCYVIDLA